MGSKKLEMRILNAHIPFPTSKFMAFEEKNWIGPREVGNENQTRILITEVPPSADAFFADRVENLLYRKADFAQYVAQKKLNIIGSGIRMLNQSGEEGFRKLMYILDNLPESKNHPTPSRPRPAVRAGCVTLRDGRCINVKLRRRRPWI